MSELRSIKTVVLGMTFVVVVMFAALIWGMTRETDLPAPRRVAPSAPWTAPLPPGKIIATTSAGPYLAVTLETGTGLQILLIDPSRGTIQGTLNSTQP